MPKSKHVVRLELIQLNSEPSQYKPMNVNLRGPADYPVQVQFEVDAKHVVEDDGETIILTPEGMADVAAQWYQTIYTAKMKADKNLSGGD